MAAQDIELEHVDVSSGMFAARIGDLRENGRQTRRSTRIRPKPCQTGPRKLWPITVALIRLSDRTAATGIHRRHDEGQPHLEHFPIVQLQAIFGEGGGAESNEGHQPDERDDR